MATTDQLMRKISQVTEETNYSRHQLNQHLIDLLDGIPKSTGNHSDIQRKMADIHAYFKSR